MKQCHKFQPTGRRNVSNHRCSAQITLFRETPTMTCQNSHVDITLAVYQCICQVKVDIRIYVSFLLLASSFSYSASSSPTLLESCEPSVPCRMSRPAILNFTKMTVEKLLTFFLPYLLTFFLPYILKFCLAFFLTYLLTFCLAFFLTSF